MIKNDDLFNLENSALKEILQDFNYPYEIISSISDLITKLGNSLESHEYIKKDNNVWIHKTVKIGNGVEILGPAIIMEGVVLRHNAYLREDVIIGPNSIIGNSCEIKNSILISNCKVPHFNYVGDSILGNNVYLGAGVILANLRLDNEDIKINSVNTNLRKIGAFIGDNSKIGCNSVICPGAIVLKNKIVYPLSVIKGIYDSNKTIKVERL